MNNALKLRIKLWLWSEFEKMAVVSNHPTNSAFMFLRFAANDAEQSWIKGELEKSFPIIFVQWETSWHMENTGVRYVRFHLQIKGEM